MVAHAEEYAQGSRTDAGKTVDEKATENSGKTIRRMREEIQTSSLPIGWSGDAGSPLSLQPLFGSTLSIVSALLGWLLTATAISLGAPFRFGTLSRFVSIRTTAKPKGAEPS